MPIERGYEQQTSGQAAPIGATVTPNAYGAQIGDALMGAAETRHQTEIRDYAIERKKTEDQELSDWQHNFSVHRSNIDDIVRQTREQAGPGAAGHADGVERANAAAKDALFANITSNAVRRHAQAQWDEFSGQLRSREQTFESGQRVAKVVTDQGRAIDLSANRVRRTGDLETYQAELKTTIEGVSMLNVDDATKQKLSQAAETSLGVAFVQHLQDTDPAKAQQVLDSGAFDHLGSGVLEQLRNGTAVEIRRQQAEAEHQAAMAKADLREAIATAKEADSQGIELDDKQLGTLIAGAQAIGDTSTVLQLQGIQQNNVFSKVYKGQSPLQREQRLGVLAAKQNPTAAEQREKKWLEDHKGALDSQFNADPVGFALQNAPAGTKPPAGDISDPAVLQARMAWRARASQAYGRDMPLFTAAEQDQLHTIKGEGAQGESRVLEVLDKIPAGRERARAAKQIDGGDMVFQHMAQLGSQARQTVRAGAQALKADKAFLTPSKTDDPDVAELVGATERELRVALKDAYPAEQEEVLTVARQFLAGVHSKAGLDASKITRGNMLLAMRVALGGTVTRDGRNLGGLAEAQPGKPFVLPERMDRDQFYHAVAAQIGKTKIFPVNPDKSPASLSRAVPVLVGSGTYRWESLDGQPIYASTGKPFVSVIR